MVLKGVPNFLHAAPRFSNDPCSVISSEELSDDDELVDDDDEAQRKVAEPGPFLGDAESGEAWQSYVEHQREGLEVSRPLHLVEIMFEDVVELVVHLLELDVLCHVNLGQCTMWLLDHLE